MSLICLDVVLKRILCTYGSHKQSSLHGGLWYSMESVCVFVCTPVHVEKCNPLVMFAENSTYDETGIWTDSQQELRWLFHNKTYKVLPTWCN